MMVWRCTVFLYFAISHTWWLSQKPIKITESFREFLPWLTNQTALFSYGSSIGILILHFIGFFSLKSEKMLISQMDQENALHMLTKRRDKTKWWNHSTFYKWQNVNNFVVQCFVPMNLIVI